MPIHPKTNIAPHAVETAKRIFAKGHTDTKYVLRQWQPAGNIKELGGDGRSGMPALAIMHSARPMDTRGTVPPNMYNIKNTHTSQKKPCGKTCFFSKVLFFTSRKWEGLKRVGGARFAYPDLYLIFSL